MRERKNTGKADELALSHCSKCNKRECLLPCPDVLISLFLDCQTSPHEAQEMMKNARQRAGI